MQLRSQVKSLQQAMASAEQNINEKDTRIADLHSNLTALDTRKDDLQVSSCMLLCLSVIASTGRHGASSCRKHHTIQRANCPQ